VCLCVCLCVCFVCKLPIVAYLQEIELEMELFGDKSDDDVFKARCLFQHLLWVGSLVEGPFMVPRAGKLRSIFRVRENIGPNRTLALEMCPPIF
jgi:hypothetical protein